MEISPARRIPVLRDRRIGTEGVPGTIPDSSAICGFLEQLEPSPSFYPQAAYERGRALWYEEDADTELAGLAGMGIFRPLMFPRFQGGESDLDTARATFRDKLPAKLDYLEGSLDGRECLVGGASPSPTCRWSASCRRSRWWRTCPMPRAGRP
ncbi:MAG: glutathione S-transferase family protein [Gammaproteobacteria bacterium]|nr:glutathione S-transferase family protein [Gammaproteobacteria bacterium]